MLQANAAYRHPHSTLLSRIWITSRIEHTKFERQNTQNTFVENSHTKKEKKKKKAANKSRKEIRRR